MLNKVLTSVDRLDYNKSVAVERNDLGHLMMYLVPIIGEFDQATSLSGFFYFYDSTLIQVDRSKVHRNCIERLRGTCTSQNEKSETKVRRKP